MNVVAAFTHSQDKLFTTLRSAALIAFPLLSLPSLAQQPEAPKAATVQVLITPNQPLNRFRPWRTLGAGIDGHNEGETLRQLSSDNIAAMQAAGLSPLTYRLRTELANEAWHWNSRGVWSDAMHQQGYWTSDSQLREPIDVSYGYRLPRRGNSIDQANNDGYSRLDDDDRSSYWKSNPYLDEHYAADHKSLPPQWIIVDLGAVKSVNAIKIAWAKPFATRYQVEYGQSAVEEDHSPPAVWRAFPNGTVSETDGRTRLWRLAQVAIDARFVRILLSDSSHTAVVTSRDIRDRLGFAVRELYVGAINRHGHFIDLIRHGRSTDSQTRMYVSSTDPWHRAGDRDNNTEQPGLDFVFRSGLTHHLPMLTPVPLLYDTPENTAAEIKYLTARGYAFEQVEMGEEPDGQFVTPEHYGALFRLFYATLRPINPQLQFGGPSLQDIEPSPVPGDATLSKAAWLGKFLKYLERHNSLDQFSFFSFEWYPFSNDCNAAKQLLDAPQILTAQLQAMQNGGLTHNLPWIISEYGYSAYGARAELDIDGALFNADSVARFLTLGGAAAYLYGYEPSDVIREQDCSAGNNMLFFRNQAGQITVRTATYWAAQLLTQAWLQPGDELHELYVATTDALNDQGNELISSYAVYRPDNLWSVLLINKDPQHSYRVHVDFHNTNTHDIATFVGPVDQWQYSREQYQLSVDAFNPYPTKAEAPLHSQLSNAHNEDVILPSYSMTIVKGRVE